MSKFYVGRNDGSIDRRSFDTYDEAVKCIARFEVSDPQGVLAGDYYIDAPEDWTCKLNLDARLRADIWKRRYGLAIPIQVPANATSTTPVYAVTARNKDGFQKRSPRTSNQ